VLGEPTTPIVPEEPMPSREPNPDQALKLRNFATSLALDA
jgi:hypothetical protein